MPASSSTDVPVVPRERSRPRDLPAGGGQPSRVLPDATSDAAEHPQLNNQKSTTRVGSSVNGRSVSNNNNNNNRSRSNDRGNANNLDNTVQATTRVGSDSTQAQQTIQNDPPQQEQPSGNSASTIAYPEEEPAATPDDSGHGDSSGTIAYPEGGVDITGSQAPTPVGSVPVGSVPVGSEDIDDDPPEVQLPLDDSSTELFLDNRDRTMYDFMRSHHTGFTMKADNPLLRDVFDKGTDVYDNFNIEEYQPIYEAFLADLGQDPGEARLTPSPGVRLSYHANRTTRVGDCASYSSWTKEESFLVVPGPWQQAVCFYMDIIDGTCYRVDQETDNLTAEDFVKYEREIIEADRKEIEGFLKHKIFEVKNLMSATQRPMSCVWVRKWKIKDGKRIVKSRLCVRGFLDPQKSMLTKHSSTATRLSQKLIVSYAACLDFDMESWDISSAFLQGLSFDNIATMCQYLGVPAPAVDRQVYIVPPGNVWYHLRMLGLEGTPTWSMSTNCHCLKLLKAMYGLNDAPLLWQLCLRYFLVRHTGALLSVFDDNYFEWKYPNGKIKGMATAHVDDGMFIGKKEWLSELRSLLEKRFGPVARQTLPMLHVGVMYERLPPPKRGYKLQQKNYALALKPVVVPDGEPTKPLDKAQETILRSGVGGLLYLCLTRPDLVGDLCILQTKVCSGTIQDLRTLNSIIARAHKYAGTYGLVFEHLPGPLCIRVYADASFATSKTAYAVEGNVVVLMSDPELMQIEPSTLPAHKREQVPPTVMGGKCHVLVHTGKLAKRVSHGTSHAESLSQYSGVTHGEMIALRMTELQSPLDYSVPLWLMIQIEELGQFRLPIDVITDCKDLWELETGQKGVPQDRTQRLIIMSLRERRAQGRIRNTLWTDTRDMLANSLTKHVTWDKQLHTLLSQGLIVHEYALLRRKSQIVQNLTESDLLKMEQ